MTISHKEAIEKYQKALDTVTDLVKAGDDQLKSVEIYLFAKLDRMIIDGPAKWAEQSDQ